MMRERRACGTIALQILVGLSISAVGFSLREAAAETQAPAAAPEKPGLDCPATKEELEERCKDPARCNELSGALLRALGESRETEDRARRKLDRLKAKGSSGSAIKRQQDKLDRAGRDAENYETILLWIIKGLGAEKVRCDGDWCKRLKKAAAWVESGHTLDECALRGHALLACPGPDDPQLAPREPAVQGVQYGLKEDPPKGSSEPRKRIELPQDPPLPGQRKDLAPRVEEINRRIRDGSLDSRDARIRRFNDKRRPRPAAPSSPDDGAHTDNDDTPPYSHPTNDRDYGRELKDWTDGCASSGWGNCK